jgi:hypothetical protein
MLNENDVKGNHDDIKYSNAMERMDIYSDSNENAIKIGGDEAGDDQPPRLPPRPPRARNTMNSEAGMIYLYRIFNFPPLSRVSHSKCDPLTRKLKKFLYPFFTHTHTHSFWHQKHFSC